MVKNKMFISEEYGIKKEFLVGQKVRCIYYHEYCRGYMKEAYKRSWLSMLIDKAFKPVKLGVVVGDAGFHPYWLSFGKKEQYLFIKFKDYILKKPIPISCIQDAKEAAESLKRTLERSKHRIGEKGYSEESFLKLTEDMVNAENFIHTW